MQHVVMLSKEGSLVAQHITIFPYTRCKPKVWQVPFQVP